MTWWASKRCNAPKETSSSQVLQTSKIRNSMCLTFDANFLNLKIVAQSRKIIRNLERNAQRGLSILSVRNHTQSRKVAVPPPN